MAWIGDFFRDFVAAVLGDRVAGKFFSHTIAAAVSKTGTNNPTPTSTTTTPPQVHAAPFGLGNADEFLSLDAFILAFIDAKNDSNKTKRLGELALLIKNLSFDKRHKLRCILGHKSQTALPVAPPPLSPTPKNSKGAPVSSPTPPPPPASTPENIKGKQFLLTLADLPDQVVMDILQATSLDTIEDLIAHLWARGKDFLAKAKPYLDALDAKYADGTPARTKTEERKTKASELLKEQKERFRR